MEPSEVLVSERPEIDSFLVADWAEAVNGKLYLMGGGFDTFFAPAFPFRAKFAFAAILHVPWADTNRRFPVEGILETIDGDPVGWRMQGELEAGRAAGAMPGEIAVVVAGPVEFETEEPVELIIKLRFAEDERMVRLRVVRTPFQIAPAPES